MSGLEKATLTNTVTGRRVAVQFNPEEYTLDRRIELRPARRARPVRARSCSSCTGNAQTVDLELLVDTTETSPAGGPGSDVRRLVQRRHRR